MKQISKLLSVLVYTAGLLPLTQGITLAMNYNVEAISVPTAIFIVGPK